ncbi:site-specific integrase [Psychroflexus salis]|uniref:Transposase n=1 Tax=Psychroflexus salis TaxID=1526574 RepID=A0A916ZV36_9FLAO|nr:site-specific integrase [Psychroflexus salis]GGE14087.1 transposase [Psychroflexus salis]
MSQNEMSIRFIMIKSKKNKQNLCPIFCRITHQGNRAQFSTGIFIKPHEWMPSKQISSNHSGSINSELELIKNKLDRIVLQLKVQENFFTAQDIIDKYKGKVFKKEHSLLKYLDEYLEKKRKLIGKDIKQITFNKFKYVFDHVKEFVNSYLKKKDIPLKDLNTTFINEFEYFLKVKKNNQQITINKSLQRFKEPIKNAVIDGYLEVDPFVNHRPKKVKKSIVFLNEEELNNLENCKLQQPRLAKVRDMFVFCCYTGLAYSEMKNLKHSNLEKGFDKKIWIKTVRQKTQREVFIPLLPKAKSIIDKYITDGEYILPTISNQRFNSYLKEIADIVGIEKRLTHHIARKTFATTVLLYNNVPIEIVSELLGHSSIKTTQDSYGKVLKQSVSREMRKLMENLKN